MIKTLFLTVASIALLFGVVWFLTAASRFHRTLMRMKANDIERFPLPTKSALVEQHCFDHGLPVRRAFLRRTALADVLGMRL